MGAEDRRVPPLSAVPLQIEQWLTWVSTDLCFPPVLAIVDRVVKMDEHLPLTDSNGIQGQQQQQ
ncbi:hypothetical protein STEG23_008435, partial [Scotinomys teguina]